MKDIIIVGRSIQFNGFMILNVHLADSVREFMTIYTKNISLPLITIH